MSSPGAAMIWSPFENEAAADECARQLLAEGLVACANILPIMRSLFVWKGELDEATECGVLFKTSERLLEQAVTRLQEIHPYDTPAIIGWLADAVNADALNWLGQLTGGVR
jgi:periplasmic divalent cation tolerance protein